MESMEERLLKKAAALRKAKSYAEMEEIEMGDGEVDDPNVAHYVLARLLEGFDWLPGDVIFEGRLGGMKVSLSYVKGTKKYHRLSYERLGKVVEFSLTRPNKFLLMGYRPEKMYPEIQSMLGDLEYMMRRKVGVLRNFDGTREATIAEKVNALLETINNKKEDI